MIKAGLSSERDMPPFHSKEFILPVSLRGLLPYFSAVLCLYSPLGKAFTMSLQTHSTHISNRHILTGKFTCLCMAFIPCCYWLLKFCSCGCGKTNKYKYIQTYMQTYTLFVKQFQQTRHAHSRPKHVPGLKIKNSMNRNEAIRYH